MENQYRDIWETYTNSWKVGSDEDKQALFGRALDQDCIYTDPLTVAQGYEQLLGYMKAFHEKIPGGYFETTNFLAHHDKSIAQWNMRDGDDVIVGTGISYGQYSDQGKLIAMTGFFEVPEEG